MRTWERRVFSILSFAKSFVPFVLFARRFATAMTHQYVIRMSGSMKEMDPATRHILQALLQAAHDETRELAFGDSCRSEFGWIAQDVHVTIGMPDGLTGSQVREALTTMTGLDRLGEFPRESDFVLEIPESDFIVEFPIDKKYTDPETTKWRKLRWRISLSRSEGPIVLRTCDDELGGPRPAADPS